MSHQNVSSKCLIKMSHKNGSSKCLIQISHQNVSLTSCIKMFHSQISSTIPIKMYHPSVSLNFLIKMYHQNVSSKGLINMYYQNVASKCPIKMYPPLLSSDKSAVAQKLCESLKKINMISCFFSLERKTTFWAGSKFYVEMWPALSKGSGWFYSRRTLRTISTRGGKKNYENGVYDDDDGDDDDNDEDDYDNDDYNVFSSSQRASNRVCTRGSQ